MSVISDFGKPQTGEISLDYLDDEEVRRAFATTVTYMIADAFQLESEEISWFNYRIKHLLSGFPLQLSPSLPNAVSHELKTLQYSKSLSQLLNQKKRSETQESVNINDWLNVIIDMLNMTFNINPIDLAGSRADLAESFRKLGIGESKNPRKALYLPNSIRFLVSRREFSPIGV